MGPQTPHLDNRWQPRRVTAGLVRALILVVPIAAGFVVGVLVTAVLPRPTASYEIVLWWVAILSVATVTATAVDRLARRFLPLAALLQMTMLFPDAAPSRIRTARRAGNVTELRRRITEAGRDPSRADVGEAAELVLSLASALSNHDRRTRGHSERTRVYTDLIAEEMGLPAGDRDRLRWAALLHDVGKLEVPAEILNKDSALDDDEWHLVKEHPLHGMRIVAPLVPWLGSWAETIEHHHERYDGTGYPHGLSGQEISLGARIVSVADAYDVMTSGRSYQAALSPAAARVEIVRMAGAQFDPIVARALMSISLGKLRWSTGPLAALAQIPFIRGIPQLGRDLAVVLTTSAVVTAGFMTGMIPTTAGSRTVTTTAIETLVAGGEIRSRDVTSGDAGLPVAAEGAGTTARGPETTARSVAAGPVSGPHASDRNSDDAEADPASPTTTSVPAGSAATTTTTTRPTTTTTAPATTTTTVQPAPGGAITARDDHTAVGRNGSVNLFLLDNDSGPTDASTLTVAAPPHGTVAMLGKSGGIRFSAPTDFTGTVTFSYAVCSASGSCSTAAVSIVVG